MKQWEIYNFPLPSEDDPHPFVIISIDEICANSDLEFVNALQAQTVRPITRPAKGDEVYLDRADGLDWKTLVKCSTIHLLEKAAFLEERGVVSLVRRRQIIQTLKACFKFF